MRLFTFGDLTDRVATTAAAAVEVTTTGAAAVVVPVEVVDDCDDCDAWLWMKLLESTIGDAIGEESIQGDAGPDDRAAQSAECMQPRYAAYYRYPY